MFVGKEGRGEEKVTERGKERKRKEDRWKGGRKEKKKKRRKRGEEEDRGKGGKKGERIKKEGKECSGREK